MNLKRWYPELAGLIVAAFITRFWSLFKPDAVVFDEVYFKEFAAHYLDGLYYFDIHPPLGKLLLAAFANLLGLSPEAMVEGTALALRLLPATAGLLLVPLVWAILRRLGASRAFAFLGGFLILAENALLVESRFILMDSLLLLLGLGALYLYLVARDTRSNLSWLWLTLAALSAGAAASIKWTGLSALAIVGLVWLWDQHGRAVSWRRKLSELTLIAFVPAIVYVSAFFWHFQLLPKSGEGDAFMSEKFQSTLVDSPYYNPDVRMSFPEKFAELNKEMFRANQTLTASHPYGSHWYTWPLEIRPIYYWQGDLQEDGRQGHIYLLGNPAIWWGVWVAILAGLAYVRMTRRKLRPATTSALAIAAAAFFINLLPFVAVARVMFLYHYFFSFIFSLIFAVMLWNDIATHPGGHQLASRRDKQAFVAVLAIIATVFIYFLSISYGTPLTPGGLQTHMWLQSWR